MSPDVELPLIVVEGPVEQFRHAVVDVLAAGWFVARGWGPTMRMRDPGPSVRVGQVSVAGDAAAAVAAVVAGVGVVVHGVGPRHVLGALCDDLRHLGTLDHRVGAARVVLDAEERRLLDALTAGQSVAAAASGLFLSRRTVERRLARLRDRFGSATPIELLAAYRAQCATVPRAPHPH